MIPLGEARRHVLDRMPAPRVVRVATGEAFGLVLAVDVHSEEAVPPFANTAMDGFAVRSGDTVGAPVELEVIETVAAGHPGTRTVGPGQASRIFTGAPMPDGADAVVMVERTEVVPGDPERVRVDVEVDPGNHVRAVGDDLQIGDRVFAAGTVLSAAHLGVLSSIGVLAVDAYCPLRVGVLSTGDELVDGGGSLEPGQIRDSNRRTLLTLVADAGCDAIDLGLVRDTEEAITAALGFAAADCDAVITSGGVSMGDIDLVKVVLDRLGDMEWMQVAIRPAKPFAFGLIDAVPVFGLPGNPVSSLVSFELFARPALRQAMGHHHLDRPVVAAIADDDLRRSPDGKTHFVRVVAAFGTDGRVHVRSSGGQGSHQMASAALANALAVVADGDGIAAGADVPVLLLGAVPSPDGLPID